MSYICTCGEKVKHAWSHEECCVKDIVKNYKNTMLYEIAKSNYPNLVLKYENLNQN